jgi:hypothetical protein
VSDLEELSKDKRIKDVNAKSTRNEEEDFGSNLPRKSEDRSRLEAEPLARQAEAEKRLLAREIKSLVGFDFSHSEFTRQLCPEAIGHFCMLWGDHGQGGYDTQANGYIQGGQGTDGEFELISIYLDFQEAVSQRNWDQMRQIIRELRQLRTGMGYSQAEERETRRHDSL